MSRFLLIQMTLFFQFTVVGLMGEQLELLSCALATGMTIEAGNVEHGHVPRSGTGTGTFREQFSVKILHKRCSSFRECSSSGDGSGNMATKGMTVVAMISIR